MRYGQAEKYEIIRLVEDSQLSVRRTLKELQVPATTFYRWYRRYTEYGYDRLEDRKSSPRRLWNRIPNEEREKVKEVALELTEKSPRELAWHITDTRGWFYLSTVLYDYSRRILSWKLFTPMGASDVQETLDVAIARTGADQVKVKHKPRLFQIMARVTSLRI